jgi:DNA-binding transcriptional ArsR family regulator
MSTDHREPYTCRQLPLTEVPNTFFDAWLNVLGLLEIRIVAAIIRRETPAPISVSELCDVTKRSRPLVVKALTRLRELGILDRFRSSRHEPFGYCLIMRAEFNGPREAPPPVKQKVLPYDSRKTATRPGRIMLNGE